MRVLVAGLGNMGRSHALAWAKQPGARIVGLVNRSPVALPPELADIPLSHDFAEALERLRPDIVVIATYSDSHAEFAIAAMRAGAHVFVEKPLATTAADARRVVETAQETGRKLVVNVLGVTSQRIDILLVGLLLSASDVGVYALATRFAEAVMLIPGAVAFVSLSRSASGERAELRDTTPRVAWASGIAAATTGISAVALSWLLSSKYLPSGFHEVPWVCAILVPGIVALAMSQVLENELVSIGGMRATVAANASSLVVVVIVAFPTILLIGLDGAAIASTCGFIARYASTVRSYLKLHELDARRYFLSSRFWRSIP